MKLYKYQALGNDYLILDYGLPENAGFELTAESVQALCSRNFGVGSDGLLALTVSSKPLVDIYNPDGSQAEFSGNGSRILAQFLLDQGKVQLHQPFELPLAKGSVKGVIQKSQESIFIEVLRSRFLNTQVDQSSVVDGVSKIQLQIGSEKLQAFTYTIGNPHCVIFEDSLSVSRVQQLGPQIEQHPLFLNRTNVQFVKVLGPHTLQLEIWERGAGYTLASGSSSCAAAAVACHLGACRSPVEIIMPGGCLMVHVGPDGSLTLEGGAKGIFCCELLPEYFRSLLHNFKGGAHSTSLKPRYS